ELVDDQQLGLCEVSEALLEPAVVMGLGERSDDRGGGGEERRVAAVNHFAAQRNGKMRLANAGRTQEQQRISVGHPAGRGQFLDELRIERRLGIELELIE